VVAAPGQRLPDLPAGVAVIEDPVEGLGPMQGIARGLAAVADRADGAFVCSTDMPFLHPAFVRRVLRELTEGVDVVLPVAHGFRQPLAAAYRTSLAALIDTLLGDGERRLGTLFQHCTTTRLDDDELLADPTLTRVDPELESVVNLNTPEDYAAARDHEPPEIMVERFGRIRAATIGEAAARVGRTLGRQTLNGDLVGNDARLPLVAGDIVAFLPADSRPH
jgi:molybdopterin-guanine dinucleotide biosynthesis protein A